MSQRMSDPSSALNDLIKKSVELGSGPPSVRRLLTTRSNLDDGGKIRKWTFGQQYANMQNKTILMVGETGTGKTTLINTMVNYYLGVKFEDHVWFEITEEQKTDQTESKTSEITVYEIISEEKTFSLTIIDTPGYGDTRGMNKDMEIPRNLCNLFAHNDGVKDLDAVCLVLKASQNRITERQRYIFDAILSLFGKDIGENIVLLITFSDGFTPTDVFEAVKKEKIPCCYNAENEPVHFLFNNRQSVIHGGKVNKQAVKSTWKMGEDSLGALFEFLKSRQRKSLTMTVNVLKERIQLEACIENLKERIEFIEAKQKELTEVQNTLDQNREQIEKDQKCSLTVNTVYKKKVDITDASWWNRKATCCNVCEENCHEFGCWWTTSASKCEVMKNNYCTACNCHCSKHVKEAKKYVTQRKEEKVTLEELKTKYSNKDVTYDENAFKSMKKEHEKMLEKRKGMTDLEGSLKNLLVENEKKKKSSVKKAYLIITKLSDIALKPDSASTIQHLDFLIPRIEEAGEVAWTQNLKELQKAAVKESAKTTVGYVMMMKKFFS
uniref:AIG1-type G domain-containing protein n=1 Tax=Astyanax mexicanus TaxID=7994 RepID=A0A3B1JWC8_ASTMX